MENEIKKAFEGVTPRMASDIFEECRACGEKVSPICMPSKRRSVNPFAVIAAVLAVMLLGVFSLKAVQTSRTVVSDVTVDVNPSILMELNKKDKVIDIKALNEDAKGVIADLKLEGKNVEDAANRLVSALVETGYIRDDANSVLITVSGKDDAKNRQLAASVSAEAEKAIGDKNIAGAVLAQVIAEDASVKALAQAQHISEGKAALAKAVAEYDHENGDAEALAQLSINDLGILAEANHSAQSASANLKITGKPSDSGYVGRDFAISAAVNAAAPTQESSGSASVRFNVEIGALSYDVDLKAADGEYKVSVNAATGEIIKMISTAIKDAVESIDKEIAAVQENAAAGFAEQSANTPSEQTMSRIGDAGEELGNIIQDSLHDAAVILEEGHSGNPGNSHSYSSWGEWGNAYGDAWEAWARHYGKSYAQWGSEYGNLWEQWAEQYADQWETWAERYDGDWEAWVRDFSGDWTSWLNAFTGVNNVEGRSIIDNIAKFIGGVLNIG